MLKGVLGFLKNVIIILSIFIITALIFIYGVDIFQPNNPYNNPSIIDNKYIQFVKKVINADGLQLFNKLIHSEGRENWLIPIGTFCSALSAFATVYLIWLQQQTIKKHDLEVETERVISHFFILLDNHRIIVNNLKFPHAYYNNIKYEEKYDCIKLCVETLRNVLFEYSYSANIDENYDNIKYISNNIVSFINECKDKRNKKSNDIEKFEYILSKTFEKLDSHTTYCLEQYFHNIYAMLKLLNENKDKIDIEEYMRTLRAEFIQDEFILIYYHAYSHIDIILKNGKQYIDKEKKFKKLIEETCFLHNLHTTLIDCKQNSIDKKNPNGIPFKLYKDSAFNH